MESEERRVLAAFADVHTPSAADAQAALARVRARIDRGEVVDVEPEDVRGGSRAWIPVVAGVVAIAAAVALAWRIDLGSRVASEVDDGGDPEAAVAGADETSAGGTVIERGKRKAAASGSASASESESASGSASASASESASGSASGSASASASASDSAKAKRRRPSARTPDATLHAEMTLLRPAQQALRAGNHRRALQLFDDHARSFPDSSLAEERALGRIEALCGLGRGDAARKAAANFGRRFPGSPYRTKADRLCEEGEP